VTGPSGAGKGTLIKGLLERLPELEAAISATTRLRRQGEEDGREYYFLSDAEFARRVADGDFLEHVTYVSGKRYGTLRSEVNRIAGVGRIPVLELETE
jgi:guanylate kinase